jgi:tetratricopeptide (TPR) repeat protein
MKPAPNTLRNRLLVLFAVVIAAALVVRVRHDLSHAGTGTLLDVEQQVRAHPDDVRAQLDWGEALYGQHRLDEAEAAFKTAAGLAPRDARPLTALAKLAMARYRRSEALGYLRASLNLNPNDAANWSDSGTLLLKQNPPAALLAFEHAAKLDPNDAVSWLRLGILEMDRSQVARGLHDLQHAAALNPNDLETEIALGNSARINDRPTIAKIAFDKALALRPDDPQALVGSANATLQLDPSPAGLRRAGEQLDKVIVAKPSGNAYLVRGHCNLLMRRYQRATTDLKTALSLDPTLIYAHSFLSQSYAALGETRLAQQESASFMASHSLAAASSIPHDGQVSTR